MMAFISLLFTVLAAASIANAASCRYIPGDYRWPSSAAWSHLNSTVNGRLIATIPRASVCHSSHYGNYSKGECETLKADWGVAQTFASYPGEIMNPYFQNQSCDPFTSASKPCELGNYAAYSINVTSAGDVIAGIRFAVENNIRLVIKTTGHDFIGRSTGHGALALWMWNLKTADVITDYKSAWYSGPAMKIGSGITAGEAETVAYQSGYRVVGGECGSVGIAGGYSQGGGHSMLSTEYGMAADQVLEWEVVTASGKHLIATPQQNADLYWALSGGGAGNYGVVLSMTSRIFKDGPMAGGSLSFANTNETSYWEAVSRWFQRTPSLAGENNTIIFLVTRDAFEAVAMTLPGQLPSAVETLLSQYLNDLKQLNITYALSTTHSDSYYDHFNAYFGPLPWGIESPATFVQNRIIPKEIVESPSATAKLMDAFRTTVADGTFFPGCLVANVSNSNYTDNAVLPAWRDTAVSCNLNAYWNYSAPMADNLALKKDMSEIYQPLIEAATPGGGVYANEMDPWYKGDWKTNIYGSAKYKRLLKIKHTYDPSHVFWAIFAVGSDELVLDGSGRLCPVGSG